MPPIESCVLAIRPGNPDVILKTKSKLRFTPANWMRVQTVILSGLPSGLNLEFVCEHLGSARVFELAEIDLQLGIAVPFDRPMLSTTPAKPAPHAESK